MIGPRAFAASAAQEARRKLAQRAVQIMEDAKDGGIEAMEEAVLEPALTTLKKVEGQNRISLATLLRDLRTEHTDWEIDAGK